MCTAPPSFAKILICVGKTSSVENTDVKNEKSADVNRHTFYNSNIFSYFEHRQEKLKKHPESQI